MTRQSSHNITPKDAPAAKNSAQPRDPVASGQRDAAQTRALLAEATGFCTPHCGAFVDVEGGTVDRLRDVLAPIPSVQAVAQAMGLTPGEDLLAGWTVEDFLGPEMAKTSK